MPKIVRQIEEEVTPEDAVRELKQFAKQDTETPIKLLDGTRVSPGMLLEPNDQVRKNGGGVLEDTPLCVSDLVPRAGIFGCVFLNAAGHKSFAFFNPTQIDGVYKAPTPKTVAKKRR